VKLRRDLANEMRDAVWFLSEHGRPRVHLGELLDEAIAGWLQATKAAHNDGRRFPRRWTTPVAPLARSVWCTSPPSA
jgi:hypothetical protein